MRFECNFGAANSVHCQKKKHISVCRFLSTNETHREKIQEVTRVVTSFQRNPDKNESLSNVIEADLIVKQNVQFISETSTCLASGSSMLYWVPAGPSLTLSPRRKPRRVINVLAASSTDGGGPSSWLDSPAEAERPEEGGGRGGAGVRKTSRGR